MRVGTAVDLILGALLGGTVGFFVGQSVGDDGHKTALEVLAVFACAGGGMLVGGLALTLLKY